MAPLLAKTPDRQFERMYRRHAGDVYRYSLAVLRNQQDAEDVTQTTFLNAFRAMQNGDRPETPKNWLITIAHNVCRQRFRQQQRRPQQAQLLEETLVEEHDDSISAEDIQRALGHLAFSQRSALVMRELEGRSYPEIANIMGLSVSAVETLLFRARRALREQLEESLTCAEAERFMSLQVDGELGRDDRGRLRAHLRECNSCGQLARRERASRGALKTLLGALPLPVNLLPQVGYSLGAKLATIFIAGAVVGGSGYAVESHSIHLKTPIHAAAAAINRVPFVRHGSTASSRRVAAVGASALPRVNHGTASRNQVRARATVQTHKRGAVAHARAHSPVSHVHLVKPKLQLHPTHPVTPVIAHLVQPATQPTSTPADPGTASNGNGNGNGNANGNASGSTGSGTTSNQGGGTASAPGQTGTTPAAGGTGATPGANGKHLGQLKKQQTSTDPTSTTPDPAATTPTDTTPAATPAEPPVKPHGNPHK